MAADTKPVKVEVVRVEVSDDVSHLDVAAASSGHGGAQDRLNARNLHPLLGAQLGHQLVVAQAISIVERVS